MPREADCCKLRPVSLICPACSASYNIPASVLGPEGRKVSCKKCGHVWHAVAATSEAPPPAPQPTPVEKSISAIEAAPPNDPPPKVDFDAPQLRVIPPPHVAQPESGPDVAEARKARMQATGLAPLPPPKQDSLLVIFFQKFFPIVSLVFLAAISAVFVLGRGPIVQKAPWMLALYNMVSISPLPPGGGITIVNVRDESRFGSMNNALILSGELANHTPVSLNVPLFKLIFTAPDGQSKTFMARSPVNKIDAGATAPFRLERPGFAQEGWDVKLTFGDGTEGNDTGKPMQSAEKIHKKSGEKHE